MPCFISSLHITLPTKPPTIPPIIVEKGAKGVAASNAVVAYVTNPASAADFAASSTSCPEATLATKLTPAPTPEEYKFLVPASDIGLIVSVNPSE